jgi:hypothetical protein
MYSEQPQSAAAGSEKWAANAKKIRLIADHIYGHMRAIFDVPEESSFWEVYQAHLREFRDATKDMAASELQMLVVDPTDSTE